MKIRYQEYNHRTKQYEERVLTDLFINIQSDAVSWVVQRMRDRFELRRSRRFRKNPNRKPKYNRIPKNLRPSSKARYNNC